MAVETQTYVYVATAAASLGLTNYQVMNLIDAGELTRADVEGIELVETGSLAAYASTHTAVSA